MYWNVLEQLNAMRKEMDRIFAGGGTEEYPFSQISFLPGRAARRYPLINLSEDKDNVYIEALAPGVAPDSWDISVVRNMLTLSGEKPIDGKDVNAEAYHRNERAAGKFIRNVELPVEINELKVTADYKDGLLVVVLPKSEKAKPKQISVSVS